MKGTVREKKKTGSVTWRGAKRAKLKRERKDKKEIIKDEEKVSYIRKRTQRREKNSQEAEKRRNKLNE